MTKVVELLKGMQAQMDKEGEADKETYKTYKCWCTTNGEEKLKALAAAEESLKQMEARIEELSATSSKLGVEIPNLAKDVAKFQEAIDKAVAIREKAVEKFTARETDLLSNLNAVNSAHATINGSSFVQLPHADASNLQRVIAERTDLLSNNDYAMMSAFLQQESPVSEQVMGILAGIKSDLEHELKTGREEDVKAQASYEALLKAKREESDAGKATLETKHQQKADADEEMARKTQDIKDLKESMGADAVFALEVKEKCKVFEKEYEERSKTRADESEAVAKALEVLTSDENHEHFSKTLSFIQVSTASDLRREKVVSTLMAVGQRLDARLVTLALRMKIDGFERVKESIDEMVNALKKEQADEVKHKDFCVDQFQQSKLATEEKTRTGNSLQAQAGDLQIKMTQSLQVVQNLQNEIAELRKQLNLAAKNRENENTNFQEIVEEQRATQTALKQAVQVLNEFYASKAEAFLVQVEEEPASKAEPAGFKSYQKNAAGNGVITMLNQLISDAKAMEVEATAAEKTAQESYEAFAKDTTTSIDKKSKAIVDETDTKARYESALQQATQSKQGNAQELARLATVEADLHTSCDFVMTNFDLRQSSRSEEIDALNQAKSFLSGAKFLQRK